MAQIVDPNSPPKAQRTLVDADSGSPSEEQFPILRPDTGTPSSPQRTVSLGAVPQQIPGSFFTDASSTMVNAPSSARGTSSGHLNYMQTPNAHIVESLGSDSLSSHQDAFHAFSTISDIALESSTALKEGVSTGIPVPPRMSSKHQSFSQLEQEVPDASTLPGSALLDKGKGKAVLGRDKLSTPEMDAYAFLGGEHSVEGSPEKSESSPNKDDTPTPSRPLLGHRPVAPGQEAGRSRSLWNLATGSRRNRPESLHEDTDSSMRVKNLSRTSTPDSGPVLRISGDADEILSDKREPIPPIPDMQNTPANRVPFKGVLSSSSSRKDKPKKVVRIAPGHRSVRTSFSSPSVKVNPIRSMRPPRMRIGSEPSSSANASPASPASTMSTKPGTPTSVPVAGRKASVPKALLPAKKPAVARAAASQETNSPQASGSKVFVVQHSTETLLTLQQDADMMGSQHANKENIENINVESSSSSEGRNVPSRWVPTSSHILDSGTAVKHGPESRESLNMSDDPTRHYDSSLKDATSDACSPKTPATAQSHGSGLLQVPSSGGMRSAANMSPIDTIETGDPSIQGESPLVGSIDTAHPTKIITERKIKAKRSFRDMFKSKHAEEELPGTEPSQSSPSKARSIGWRLRNSAHFPKVHLASIPQNLRKLTSRSSETPGPDTPEKDVHRQTALELLEATSSCPTQEVAEPAPAALERNPTRDASIQTENNVATAIINLADYAAGMTPGSEQLRTLLIAEVSESLQSRSIMHKDLVLTVNLKQACLNCYEFCAAAIAGIQQAQQGALDAQAAADRAEVCVARFDQLREGDFEPEELDAIEAAIRGIEARDANAAA